MIPVILQAMKIKDYPPEIEKRLRNFYNSLSEKDRRRYAALLQEWMDTQSIRDSFQESEITLSKLSGLKVSSGRFEVVNRNTGKHYAKFYEGKKRLSSDSEGDIQAV